MKQPSHSSTHSPKLIDYMGLVLTGLVFGIAFLFIKVGVKTIPIFTVVTGRLAFASLLFFIVFFMRGGRIQTLFKFWKTLFLIGLIANTIPFALIAWGVIYINSGLASVFMTFTPIFTAILSHFIAEESLSFRRTVGLLLGIAGVSLLFLPEIFVSGWSTHVLAQLACILATFCYAIASLQIRRFSKLSTWEITVGATFFATLGSLPFSLWIDRPWELHASLESFISVVLLGVVSTAMGLALYYHLVRKVGAVWGTTVTYLAPLFGLVFGILILDEEPNILVFVALPIIFLGVGLISLKPK